MVWVLSWVDSGKPTGLAAGVGLFTNQDESTPAWLICVALFLGVDTLQHWPRLKLRALLL